MYRKKLLSCLIAFFVAVCFSTGLSAEGMPPLSNQKSANTTDQSTGEVSESGAQNTENVRKHLFDLKGIDFKSHFFVGLGYRSDDLEWNISGDITGNNPNILSELTWEDLGIFQVEVENRTSIRGIYFRGSLAYGWIFSGDVQDSDYRGDDRTLELSRSNNNADDGNTFDGSVGVGYQFLFKSGFFGIVPMIGYSYHEQNLTLTDGNQTLTSPVAPPLGPFSGLDSTYDTQWRGPWAGVDVIFGSAPSSDKAKTVDEYELILGFEYHWPDYKAEADWNLRTDLAHPKSFEHDADGTGVILSADLNVCFNAHWALNLNCYYQSWETNAGIDRAFFADGTIFDTRLNEVQWDSYALTIGATYRF